MISVIGSPANNFNESKTNAPWALTTNVFVSSETGFWLGRARTTEIGIPQYHQEAIREFEKAIELDARNTSVYFQFAELYEAKRLPENAIGLYRKILEIDREHSKARERLREAESALKGKRAEKGEKSVSLLSRLFHRKPAGPLAIPAPGTTELPSEEDISPEITSASASSAKASAHKSVELHAVPNVEQVQALKREVQALREQLKLKETPGVSQRAPLPAAIPDGFSLPADGDVHGTESSSNSGSNEAPVLEVRGTSLPIKHDPVPTQLTAAEQEQFPKPPLTMSLPKSKWRPRAGQNFTPAFREGVLRLALLTTALVVTVGGAAWYRHRILSNSAAKKPSVRVFAIGDSRTSLPPGSGDAAKDHSEFSNTKVASDPPATSPGIPSLAAESPSGRVESSGSGSVTQPAVRRTSPPTTLPAKRAVVPPTAKATSDPIVASAAENVMIPPKLIKSVRAVASPEAVRDFETGNVVMDAVVGTDGEVHFISVLSGPPSLRAAAVEAVKQYRYQPATRNGQIVPAHVNITIHFRFES